MRFSGPHMARHLGGDRSTTNRMIPGVATLAKLHYLGLLVKRRRCRILLNRRTRASAELQDFIVRIVNDFEVPVLMLGTSETGKFLSSDVSGDSPHDGVVPAQLGADA